MLIAIRFTFALDPMEQFYLPGYIRASLIPSLRASGKYQIPGVPAGKYRLTVYKGAMGGPKSTTVQIADVIEIPVQVNGKVRGKIQVPAEAGENEVIDIARADQNVGRHLAGQTVQRAIYVRGRIVNFVVGAK